jgi:hypothetical protein
LNEQELADELPTRKMRLKHIQWCIMQHTSLAMMPSPRVMATAMAQASATN